MRKDQKKKPIVSVTYENERISLKKQLAFHKMCVSPVWSMGRFMAVLWALLETVFSLYKHDIKV